MISFHYFDPIVSDSMHVFINLSYYLSVLADVGFNKPPRNIRIHVFEVLSNRISHIKSVSEIINDLFASEGHSYPNPGKCSGFGKCLHHNNIVISAYELNCTFCSKINICLINNDNSVPVISNYLFNII